jgi:superfamily II DNA or RNA helicase
MPTLRPYQASLISRIEQAWSLFFKVVFAVAPCGAGKTVVFSEVMRKHVGAGCVIAHRDKLVTQISLSLARNGVRHRIIGSDDTAKAAKRSHLKKLGRHFVDPNALIGVAGVGTLARKTKDSPEWPWICQVTKWVGDEGHHFLKENQWGRAVKLFTSEHVRGLLVSATPSRADGNGLGSHSDGLADVMVEAPSLRELIHMGYLTDYRIFTAPSDIDYTTVPVGPSGELVHAKLCQAVHASDTFVGDVVKHYLRITPGKLGITFAVDVASAVEIAVAFKLAGVPAEVVHADTPEDLRNDIFARFENRQVLQLVNVDLLGEGVDFPAAEVVSLARKTESFSLFVQQSLRPGRVMLDDATQATWDERTDEQRRAHIATGPKPHFVIIDHVGNVFRHAVMRVDPWLGTLVMDLCHREWTLDRRVGRTDAGPTDAIPFRFCSNLNVGGTFEKIDGVVHKYGGTGTICDQPFERFRVACPHCDFPVPLPADRSAPEMVEGDLNELDAAMLAQMYAKIEGIKNEAYATPFGASDAIIGRLYNIAHEKRQAHVAVVGALAWYGGYLDARGITDRAEQWREFFITFGTDVGTIQTLPAREMWEWVGKISAHLALNNIDATVSLNINSVQLLKRQ